MVHTGWLSLWEGNAISFFSHETKVSVCSLPTTQRRVSGAKNSVRLTSCSFEDTTKDSFFCLSFVSLGSSIKINGHKIHLDWDMLLFFPELSVFVFCALVVGGKSDQVPHIKVQEIHQSSAHHKIIVQEFCCCFCCFYSNYILESLEHNLFWGFSSLGDFWHLKSPFRDY